MNSRERLQAIRRRPTTSMWLAGAVNALVVRDAVDAFHDAEALYLWAEARAQEALK